MTNLLRMAFAFPAAILALVATTIPVASAHPEDEICTGSTGTDPVLCRALQDMDRSSADRTQSLETVTVLDRPVLVTAGLYTRIGIRHILPGGADHILFVLALFLSARRVRALILQISAFTLGHTATLAAVAIGWFAPPSGLVEIFIAASISVMAFGAISPTRLTRIRLPVIFTIGLVHGMGFAGFFGSLGLPDHQFWSALIGFNLGVEAGQLVIVGLAGILTSLVRKRMNAATYRRLVVWPISGLIGTTGAVWALERCLTIFVF